MKGTTHPRYKDFAQQLAHEVNLYISSNDESNWPTASIKMGNSRRAHYAVVSIEQYRWDDGIEIVALLHCTGLLNKSPHPHITVTLTQNALEGIARECGIALPVPAIQAVIDEPRDA